MKFKKDEIMNLLGKAVSDAMGTDDASGSDSNDNGRLSKLEKSVSTVSKQIETIADLASKGFEKPKTVEEVVAEQLSPITKSIEDLSKKINGEDDSDTPLPTTKGEFQEMVTGMIKKALGETSETTGKPKGKGKDAEDDDDDIDDEAMTGLVKELESGEMTLDGISITDDLAKEENDVAGNPLSKEARVKRAKLDEHLGKLMSGSKSAQFVKNVSDDDDDE